MKSRRRSLTLPNRSPKLAGAITCFMALAVDRPAAWIFIFYPLSFVLRCGSAAMGRHRGATVGGHIGTALTDGHIGTATGRHIGTAMGRHIGTALTDGASFILHPSSLILSASPVPMEDFVR